MASPRPLDDALIDAVLAAPDDDAPRMVLADRLIEQGDPRGRFIAVQCALARATRDREALLAEERALLSAHGRKWLAPLGLKAAEATFCRGMVEVVTLPARRIDALQKTFREPLRALHLTGKLAPDDARALVGIPALRELHFENRAGPGIGDDGLASLLASGVLRGTRSLSLANNNITDTGAENLAASDDVALLEALNLHGNNLMARGMRAFARSAPLSGLRRLDLYRNPLGPSGASAMVDGDGLRKLVRLSVYGTALRSEGLSVLAGALTELRWFDAGKVATNESAMQAIAALPKLEHLDLYHANVGDKVIAALAASPHMVTLRALRLMNNQLGDLGASALVASPHLQDLTELELRGNPIGPAAKAALVARFAGAVAL